jgi:hypothetical protein
MKTLSEVIDILTKVIERKEYTTDDYRAGVKFALTLLQTLPQTQKVELPVGERDLTVSAVGKRVEVKMPEWATKCGEVVGTYYDTQGVLRDTFGRNYPLHSHNVDGPNPSDIDFMRDRRFA